MVPVPALIPKLVITIAMEATSNNEWYLQRQRVEPPFSDLLLPENSLTILFLGFQLPRDESPLASSRPGPAFEDKGLPRPHIC
jgi:hypothetical protein